MTVESRILNTNDTTGTETAAKVCKMDAQIIVKVLNPKDLFLMLEHSQHNSENLAMKIEFIRVWA